MTDFTADELAAYADRNIIARNLVTMWPRNRDTGAEVQTGFWSGTGNRTMAVLGGLTVVAENRNFIAGGALVSVGSVVMTDDLSIRSLTVDLNPLHADVANAYRGNNMRLARIEVHRAIFKKDAPRVLVAPARCRFVGFINKAPLVTPQEGGKASLTLECQSITRELTRTNSDLRSHESQQRRAPGDNFFQYVGATSDVQVIWGGNKG